MINRAGFNMSGYNSSYIHRDRRLQEGINVWY